MASYSSDRRSVLKIIGAIGATCTYPFAGDELFGQIAPVHEHPPETSQPSSRFLAEPDFATISRLADLIIPETDTPGAIGAGVPDYIDGVIAANIAHQLLVADGLRWLDAAAANAAGKKFIELSQEQQLTILEPLCEAADEKEPKARNAQFFALVKKLTADGYYTSKIGLINELGYKGNSVQSEFPGCIHEH